jgi:hypothetical protein
MDHVFMLDDTKDKLLINRRAMLVLGSLASASEVFSRTGVARLSESFARYDFAGGLKENKSACIYWNARARQLVSEHRLDPVYASRTYALLSLAQAIAAQSAVNSSVVSNNRNFERAIINAGVSAASIRFLSLSFPTAVDHNTSIQQVATDLRSSGLNGKNIEKIIEPAVEIASRVVDRRAGDGSDSQIEINAPKGRACWYSMDGLPAVRPNWGSVKTLCVDAIDRFVPGPPPDIDSAEFKAALIDVKRRSSRVTRDQKAMIDYWADGVGTATPSGHWNLIGCNYLSDTQKNETERANILAVLNIAMFEAGIACWGTKFKYWFARPSQVDPTIVVSLKVPNFPSYFSGHSAFSGAASTVLSHFSNKPNTFKAMANAASQSRVLCGIHYKFDCDTGLRVGREIGEHTVKTLASSQSLAELLERK